MKVFKFFIFALFIGAPSLLILGAIFMDDWRMIFKHGIDDFLGACLLTGSFVIWIYRKFILTGVTNKMLSDAFGGAGDLAKLIKNKSNKNDRQKFSNIPNTLFKGVVITGAVNAVFMPVIIPAHGCNVHGVVPKGIGQWEVHYSVPILVGIQKNIISRNSSGFTHSEHWFDVKWPNPFM